MKIGDRVRHKTLTLIQSAGTIIAAEEPFKVPLITAEIELEARFKVKWDEEPYGESDWLSESELELIA